MRQVDPPSIYRTPNRDSSMTTPGHSGLFGGGTPYSSAFSASRAGASVAYNERLRVATGEDTNTSQGTSSGEANAFLKRGSLVTFSKEDD